MKISLNWLREFVELPDGVTALAELLTRAGVEVEGVETRGVSVEKVVVAQILESARHPNADRLSVCKVDDGSGVSRQIVCGAKNYKVSDKVPLALPGAVLPGDFKIKASKLRGVDSEGMLCSARELGISEDAEGLLILPASAEVGRPLTELFPADTILDLEITPNRPDLLSHIGIAREVSCLTGKALAASVSRAAIPAGSFSVEIEAAAECPLYSATRISNVKVEASPGWLAQKLEAVGVRGINDVVDVTNFVMFERGQPLHAFDAAKIVGGLRVRFAAAGERFLALDGRTYLLEGSDLVIADARRAVAIAGVMGGEETGVTGATTDVLLESARFDPAHVRRTARRLGLHSDSSYRFERGVDPAGVMAGAERAAGLMAELCGGVVEGMAVAGNGGGLEPPPISLRYARCRRIIGAEIEDARVDGILSGFGLEAGARENGATAWKAPTFRADLTREIDLIEEVMRVVGMETVPAKTAARFSPASVADAVYDRDMRVRRALAAQGFFEARTSTLVSEKALEFSGGGGVRRVRNPLNEEQSILRPGLLAGLLRIVENNVRFGTRDLRLFELGKVFGAVDEEKTHVALAMTGAVHERYWREPHPRQNDLFDLKGALAGLGFGDVAFERTENAALALALAVLVDGKQVGFAGQVWPARSRELGLTGALYVAEVELAQAVSGVGKGREDVAVYPAITRDIALIVPMETPHGRVMEILDGAKETILEKIELFDLFSDPAGEKVPSGQKSLAYSLTYRAKNRTLTTEEANGAHARLKELPEGWVGCPVQGVTFFEFFLIFSLAEAEMHPTKGLKTAYPALFAMKSETVPDRY